MIPLLLWLLLAPPKPIRVDVCCPDLHEVADLRVIIHTQSDPTNYAVSIDVNGPAYWSYSEIPLNGDTSPATLSALWYRRVPSGLYVVTVQLFRHDGQTYKAGEDRGRVQIGALPD